MNWDTILLAAIAAVPPTLVALAAFMESRKAKEKAVETHLAVNSRMEELLRLAKSEATAVATLDEKAAEKGRQGIAAVAVAAAVAQETALKTEAKKP